MFFKKKKAEENIPNEEALRRRLKQLIEELEILKITAEEKLQSLEENVELRMQELEERLTVLEERLYMLNLVLASLEPSKRLN
jgi:LPS O-antigen subunit length determinant protein (WzzB/FepE family)